MGLGTHCNTYAIVLNSATHTSPCLQPVGTITIFHELHGLKQQKDICGCESEVKVGLMD